MKDLLKDNEEFMIYGNLGHLMYNQIPNHCNLLEMEMYIYRSCSADIKFVSTINKIFIFTLLILKALNRPRKSKHIYANTASEYQ